MIGGRRGNWQRDSGLCGRNRGGYSRARDHRDLYGRTRTHGVASGDPRFRIETVAGARMFRLRKNFLGTSRMIFGRTSAASVAGAGNDAGPGGRIFVYGGERHLRKCEILREPLTFYRLHESNVFQVADGNMESLRRKQGVLAALAESLRNKLGEMKLSRRHDRDRGAIRSKTEADLIRLTMENGWPLETVRAGNFKTIASCTSMPPFFIGPSSALRCFRRACCLRKFTIP